MAHNSTSRRRFGAALGALSAGVIAAAALIGMAGTASAHTPKIDAECTDGVSWLKVELTAYNDKEPNTVAVTVDDEVLVETEFARTFEQEWKDLDPTAAHNVTVAVQAWDDPNSSKGFSFKRDLTIDACVQPTTPPEEPTTTTTPPQSSTTEVAPPAPTTTEEAAPPVATTEAEVEDVALAETGASIAIPLGIGAVLLAGGVVLMIVVRRRGRNTQA